MDFKCRHLKRSKRDGLLYAYTLKTKPKGRNEIHVKISAREKQIYILMRKHKMSMNAIARFFGRSVSCIWKTLYDARQYVVGKSSRELNRFAFPELHFDNRKLPAYTRRIMVGHQRGILERLRQRIEDYVLGDGDEPP